MDYITAFEKLKPEIERAKTDCFKDDFAVQVTLSDKDCGGKFYIQFNRGQLHAEPYDYVDNTADIVLSRMDMKNILSGKLKAENAMKKVEIHGDSAAVKRLFEAISNCTDESEKHSPAGRRHKN